MSRKRDIKMYRRVALLPTWTPRRVRTDAGGYLRPPQMVQSMLDLLDRLDEEGSIVGEPHALPLPPQGATA